LGATVASWFFVVDANVEELTAVRIWVEWIGYHSVATTFYLGHFRAFEVDHISGCAAFAISFSRILANTTVGIENESGSAGDQIVLTVRAEEELVAYSRIRVGKVTVGTRAIGRFLGRLELFAVFAINVEGIVALRRSD